jgi:hypothetical protein
MLKLFILAQVAAASLRKREEGQTMAEYGIVLAVITIAVIVRSPCSPTTCAAHSRTSLESCPGTQRAAGGLPWLSRPFGSPFIKQRR